ncbi:methionine adenosyltransferase [Microtetraspora fusca]|uniref:Methionine adenosyltransferase n=1 Tax=Microtetraspora fusca TaxID=1997 RepID=A0ABW6VLE7_MICFU
MRHHKLQIDQSTIVVEPGRPAADEVTILERKGIGHPDTLADHLAERLSRTYSRYTLDTFGAVLHHNFDKLALLGGACEVRYGTGRMLAPVRVLVNGRAARACGNQKIPVEDLVAETVRGFFAERLPELDGHLSVELNITSNPSPGAVITDSAVTDRAVWFAPRSLDDLRERRIRLANDTSLGTGWAPENSFESFARELVDKLAAPGEFARDNPWCGSDIKLMGYATADEVDVVMCVPQKSAHVRSRTAYVANREKVLDECHQLAAERLGDIPVRFRLNVRDILERDELYLTYTGSSIESGDEGVVGRGNRVNGLITPLRPMNMEGANGKNPVYHVGKLYNLAARRLAQRLHEATGDYAEVHLISATGQRLDRPWRVLVRLAAPYPQMDKVHALISETLNGFPALTDEILTTELLLS